LFEIGKNSQKLDSFFKIGKCSIVRRRLPFFSMSLRIGDGDGSLGIN
jgi:hypothetical protein